MCPRGLPGARIRVNDARFASKLSPADHTALQSTLNQCRPLLILRQVLDSELLEEGPHVGLDRIDAEVQLAGDHLIGGRSGERGFVLEGATEGEQDAALTG